MPRNEINAVYQGLKLRYVGLIRKNSLLGCIKFFFINEKYVILKQRVKLT